MFLFFVKIALLVCLRPPERLADLIAKDRPRLAKVVKDAGNMSD